jgi:hypothetical protein
MQMLPDSTGCRFIWVSDFLPQEHAKTMEPLIDAGCQVLKAYLEGRPKINREPNHEPFRRSPDSLGNRPAIVSSRGNFRRSVGFPPINRPLFIQSEPP